MKKLFPASSWIASLFAKTERQKAYRWIAVVFLAGCTNTQVRWDATRMRKDVMVYYNDQIMDNLVKAKNNLPFVHVDIQTLTSTGASQIAGTIGYGETTSNNSTRTGATRTTTDTTSATPSHVVAAAVAVTSTLAHAAMRPFTYSVTPQQTETLTIIAAPALGSQAQVSPTPSPAPEPSRSQSALPSPTPLDMEITKTTEVAGQITTEKVPKKPSNITIYELYQRFACQYVSKRPVRPNKDAIVPGTVIKRWQNNYYYIEQTDEKRQKYYELCKALFTKGQAGSLEKKLEVIQAAAAIR